MSFAMLVCAALAAPGSATEPPAKLALAWKASELSYHGRVHLLADGTVALGFPHVGAWRDGKRLWQGGKEQTGSTRPPAPPGSRASSR